MCASETTNVHHSGKLETVMVGKVEAAVKVLIKNNCRHKKTHVFTGEAQWIDIIPHMVKEIKELNEVLAEVSYDDAMAAHWQRSEVLEELADIYGILVHAVLKAGYSMNQIENRCLLKFAERFDDVTLIGNGADVRLHYMPRMSDNCTNAVPKAAGCAGTEGSQGSG